MLSYCSCYHLAQYARDQDPNPDPPGDPSDRVAAFSNLAQIKELIRRFETRREADFHILTEVGLRPIAKVRMEAANFWWNSLSQDFRCGNFRDSATEKRAPICYCPELRKLHDRNQEDKKESEESVAANVTRDFRLAFDVTEQLLQNHPFKKPEAFAYVTYGDLDAAKLTVLRLRVKGPAPLESGWARRLTNLETTWLPVEVYPEEIPKL